MALLRRIRPAVHGPALAAFVACVLCAGLVSCDARRPPAPTAPPARIVTIAPNAAEIIAALGAADRLVGVSRYCDYPPRLAGLPRVGGLIDPDLETVLRLKPDLVILRGGIPQLERVCRDQAIRLYRDRTESFDDIFVTIRELGAILQRDAAAGALIGRLRARIDRIDRALAGRPRPRVLLTTNREPDSLDHVTTAGKNTFVDAILAHAGGRNVFGDLEVDYPQVALEEILLARPEVIIEVMPSVGVADEALRARIEARWRRLGPLPALEAGRLHVLVDDDLVIPSPRVADAIARVARLLHPEVRLD